MDLQLRKEKNNKNKMKELRFDRILCILGLLVVGYVIIKRTCQIIAYGITKNPVYLIQAKSFLLSYGGIILTIFLICLLYLLFNKKLLRKSKENPETKKTYKNTNKSALILNTLFYIFIALALIFLFFSEPYSRPLAYLIFICLAYGTISLEIIFLSKDPKYIKIILLHLIILAGIVMLVPHLRFFGLLASDPYYHSMLSEGIVNTGHMAPGYYYSIFPGMHYAAASVSLLTGLAYKSAVIISTGIFFIFGLLLLFFIGKKMVNARVGLFAVLIVIICDQIIASGISLRPVVLGLAASIFIINSLIRKKEDNAVIFKIIALFFMILLIISHMYTSIIFLIILLSFLLGNSFYEFITKQKHKKRNGQNKKTLQTKQILGIILVLLFLVSLFSYWGYVTRGKTNKTYLESIVELGKDMVKQNVDEVKQTPTAKPRTGQRFTDFLPFISFYVLAGIGLLYWLKKKERYAFIIALASILLFLFTYIPILLGTDIMMAYKVESFLYFLMSFPTAIIIAKICKIQKKALVKGFIVFLILSIFCFIMITSMIISKDNPLVKGRFERHNFYRSEVQAKDTLVNFYNYDVISDSSYRRLFRYKFDDSNEDDEIITITMSKKVATNRRIIVLRNFVLNEPFKLWRPRIRQSLISLYSVLHGNKDFQNIFENHRYNKVYNNKVVTAYTAVQ